MMENKRKFLLGFACILSCIVLLTGCETVRKKFTRKRKTTDSQEEVVITPRDYSLNPYPPDVLYKQYFAYWKSWNQELITSLNDQASYKKMLDCADQALINLKKMATYLKDEQAKELGVYVQESEQLKADVMRSQTSSHAELSNLRYTAERILSNVNRKFDARKMKDFYKL